MKCLASFRSLVVLSVLVAVAAAPAPAPLPTRPPPPAVRPVTQTLYGTKVTDRYRYFEDLKRPDVQAFFRAQNAYTRNVLARLDPARTRLLARIKQLDNAGTSVGDLQRVGNWYFYNKQKPGENLPKLYVRPASGGPERLLLDPSRLTSDTSKHYTVDYFAPSYDGAYVAYGLSEGGSEQSVLHVLETATGRTLPDTISRARFGVSSWRLDNNSFYYLRENELAPGEPATDQEQKIRTYLHVLGHDPDTDVGVGGYGVSQAVPVPPTAFDYIATTPASDYALAIVQNGVQNEVAVYAAPAATVTGADAQWKKIVDVSDDVTAVDLRGSAIYLLSHKGASNYKVLATSLAAPDFAAAKTIVAPSRAVIGQIAVASDGLYVRSRIGGFGRITRVPLDADGNVTGAAAAMKMPFEGSLVAMAVDPRVAGTTFGLTGWTHTLLYYRNGASLAVVKTNLKPPSPIDASAYTSAEVQAPSADGTLVPLSLVYRKGLKLDGSHPAYLTGYGAYGDELNPGFDPLSFAWLERNGVYAYCHVRGGGWYGEDWHRAGMLATKQHTIEDFVGCGRWLVAHHYTTPQRLAGEGTSAGGITIGGAITQAPQLFAAALDVVGAVDALRSEFSPNGPPNIPEFGTQTTATGFHDLYPIDAYLHVRDGVAYPAVMVITGINDPRVSPWEPGKFAARLAAASSSGRPILLRVDYDSGHGFLASSRAQSDRLLADEYSFLLWQLGDPAFQVIPQRLPKR
ncbi:MAG: prolyl oligopeptidase family serine peptidase [Candidatus Lustribacter sp.]|jgi:prolyl oligopeptidase